VEAGAAGDGELVQLEMGEVLRRVAREGDLAAEITA
jgi:hypothetical protein